MLDVSGTVNDRHPATTELRLDSVAIGEGSLEFFCNAAYRDGSRLATTLSYDIQDGRVRSQRVSLGRVRRAPAKRAPERVTIEENR